MNPLDAIIAELDSTAAVLEEHGVADALQGHDDKSTELSEADRRKARSDFVAFRFVGKLEGKTEWGTRFGPMASGTNSEGTPWEIPPLSDINGDAVRHWRERASTLKHPVLVARFSDLAWDLARLAQEPAKLEDAQLASDSYLNSATEAYREDLHERLTAAVRAFDIAAQIKDTARKAAARAVILDLHRKTLDGKPGWWWVAPRRLLRDNKSELLEPELQALIESLETLVTMFGDTANKTTFDPHQHEDAAEYLIAYYRKCGRDDEVMRLTEGVARTFEEAAKVVNVLVASSFLRKSADSFRDAGMKEESARVRIALEDALKASKDEMSPIGAGTQIPWTEIEKYADSIVDENPARTLLRIAAKFLCSRATLERQVQEQAKSAPLQAMIDLEIVENNRVVGVVGPLRDDLLGRLVQQADLHFTVSDVFLMEVLDRALEVHNFTPTFLAGWINRHGLFEDYRFLILGLGAWLSQDDAAAVHLLVPQVESALRAIATSLSLPVTKPHPVVKKASIAINLGDILANETIANALGPDITLYFRALYSDPRGKNLRNRVAHGLFPANSLGPHIVRQVVHSLLVLGVWKELASRPRSK